MNNLMVIFLTLPCSILLIGIILGALSRDQTKRLTGNMVFICAMLLLWQVLVIAFYATQSYPLSAYLFDLKLPFASFTALAMLLFILRFYGLDAYHSPVVILGLSVVPLITLVVVLFFPEQSYVRLDFAVLSTQPYHKVSGSPGPWYWVNAGYIYLIFLIAFCTVVLSYQKSPPIYRNTSRVFIISMGITLLVNLLYLLKITPTQIDFSYICGSICALFLYLSMRDNQEVDFFLRARNGVFDELPEAILVLNDEDKVLYCNKRGQEFIQTLRIDLQENTYSEILDKAFAQAEPQVFGDKTLYGVDYCFTQTSEKTTYNVREKDILDKKGQLIGRVAIYSDVSENRADLHQLEVDAGLDVLTGLLNRGAVERVKREIDIQEMLPLGVIVGDLNNLKQINDTWGHQQGDLYLRTVAESLLVCAPPNAQISRTGGDEFLILLPQFTREQAEKLVEEIQTYLSTTPNLPVGISIALGFGIKEKIDTPLAQVINQADSEMYSNKKIFKAQILKGNS